MTQNELSAALDLQRKIDRLEESLKSLHDTGGLKGVCSDNTPVMGGEAGVYPGQLAVEIEQEVAGLKEQQKIERAIIQRFIEKQQLEELERKLLHCRYVECLTWTDVALSVRYSKRYAMKLHNRVLKKIKLEKRTP